MVKKSTFILLIVILLSFTTLITASAAKPVTGTSGLIITSTSSYKNIILTYSLENAKKLPDRYIVKRDVLKVYEGRNTSFNDTGLHSGTKYIYTVEAWLGGKILSSATYSTTTTSIVIQPLEMKSAILSDKSVVITWPSQTSGFSPDPYKIFVDGILKTIQPPSTSTTQTTTILDLQLGNHTIKIEGWYQDELVSQGSQLITIPEAIVIVPIEVAATVYSDFSADILYSIGNLQADNYVIFINNTQVYNGYLEQPTFHFSPLTPGLNYTVRVEAYSNENLIGKGSTTFTTPYLIKTDYEFNDFSSREAVVTFSYNAPLQPADRMVITRKKMMLLNGVPTEEVNSEVIYDGTPISSYTENQFIIGVTRYKYYVANYYTGMLVGSGNTSVPNIFDY
ncbi:MAG: hypothetical protein K6T88_00920 [Bacillus sp. (in: Bacteria)]|nr:hypothetical protein [Bacillus sp. (in: firmicutes)]